MTVNNIYSIKTHECLAPCFIIKNDLLQRSVMRFFPMQNNILAIACLKAYLYILGNPSVFLKQYIWGILISDSGFRYYFLRQTEPNYRTINYTLQSFFFHPFLPPLFSLHQICSFFFSRTLCVHGCEVPAILVHSLMLHINYFNYLSEWECKESCKDKMRRW